MILRRIFDDAQARKRALSLLKPEHFVERRQRWLFKVAGTIGSNGPITADILRDFISKRLTRQRTVELVAEEIGKIFGLRPILGSEFDYALSAVQEEARTSVLMIGVQAVARAIAEGNLEKAEALLKDVPYAGEKLRSDQSRLIDARAAMATLSPDSPSTRYPTGIQVIDETTGGGRLGEFWIWAAYISEYKTTFLLSIAHEQVLRGKSVFYVALEGAESEAKPIRRRLLLQHAQKLGAPFSLNDLVNGDPKVWQEVALDFQKNPAYGRLTIWRPPLGVTILDCARELEYVSKDVDYEVLVLDYVQKLAPLRRRNEGRDERNETLEATQRLACEARDKRGVWLVTGYQTSTAGRKRAEEQGYYDLGALSETLLAGQAASVVCWSLATEAMKLRKEVKTGLAKARDAGTAGTAHYLALDPQTGFISKTPVFRHSDDEFDFTDV